MWIEGQKVEDCNVDGSTLSKGRNGIARSVNTESVKKIGIWIQGVDRLGAGYEGIWRVIKRFLISSDGSAKRFCLVAPARFQLELEEFLSDLPVSLRSKVEVHALGDVDNRYDEEEGLRQATHANEIDVDAWLVPNPMWGAARHLIRPKLVWFHDFVLLEFPQSYPRNLYLEFQDNVRGLVEAGAFFVFTSPYVKQKHGHEFFGIPASQSTLILNPPIDGSGVLRGIPEDPAVAGDIIRLELRENLKRWCTPAHANLFFHHISTYPFESVPYFFISSQNREHKNFLRLAQAHSSLLRERYSPYSTFTTALVDVAGSSPLEMFLKRELLMGDFMSVGKVSEITHALLYKFARLTIHPSTFEGNLPLPFAESVSVGTPCIMPYSRAFADYIDKSMHPWIFYNPTQPGILEKIEEAENRREDFIVAQTEIIGKLQSHTLNDFFTQHLEAFEASRRIQPRAAEYFLFTEVADRSAGRRKRLEGMFTFSPRLPAQSAGPQSVVQTRFWESFELLSAKEGSDTSTLLHWAAYLGNEQARGTSYFILYLDDGGSATDLEQLGLFAEIGSWNDDEYEVAESCAFRFNGLGEVPSELVHALQQTKAVADLRETGQIAWTKLSWKRGIIPEIRIGGMGIPSSLTIKARLARLTRVHAGLHSPKGGNSALG